MVHRDEKRYFGALEEDNIKCEKIKKSHLQKICLKREQKCNEN